MVCPSLPGDHTLVDQEKETDGGGGCMPLDALFGRDGFVSRRPDISVTYPNPIHPMLESDTE